MSEENKLEVRVYKNYRELCEALGWEIKTSNSKKKQLKDLECMCEYHRDGNKFVIDEVYEDFILLERRGREKSLITEGVELSILYLLTNEVMNTNKAVLQISKGKLLYMAGLINNQFNQIMYSKEIYSKITHSNLEMVEEFFTKAMNNINGYLNRAIKSLEKKALISCNKDILCIYKDGKPEKATTEETELVLECRRRTLEEWGVDTEDKIKWADYNSYKEDVIKKLKPYKITNYYYIYNIIGNKNYIAEEYEKLKYSIDQTVENTNLGIQEVVYNTFKNKKDKLMNNEAVIKEEENIYLNGSFIYVIERLIKDAISLDEDRLNYFTSLLEYHRNK